MSLKAHGAFSRLTVGICNSVSASGLRRFNQVPQGADLALIYLCGYPDGAGAHQCLDDPVGVFIVLRMQRA